ncbi:MAG: U32 family peptidase [Parabacteroides sp.]|nr:U32 family peptidase [Parabacteroides sp.]
MKSEGCRPIELLAPARDLLCGKEAILHGADAVYIGAPRFGARSAAGNSVEDIAELCAFAHLYGVRIYVALNTILREEELPEAERLIHQLYAAGVDALIVQDMGITQLDLPPIPLHASTQMDNRTPEKVRFLEEVGFTQVVLARELTLEQIRGIAEQTSVPLEVFVHGALCVSYSGQCYLSAALSGRSANRGECAQYCRLPYRMIDAEGREIVAGKHLLSLKDMNRSDQLEALLDAGVSSLKIEGRLKEVPYVKNVTAYYRQCLDTIFTRRTEYRRASYGRSRFDFEPALEKSFNRGFTPFFLYGRRAGITSFDTPKSLGEPIGTVKELKGNSFTIAGVKTLHNGDGLTFFNEKGELEGFRVNRVENNRVFTLDRPVIRPKMALYRNVDQVFESVLVKPSAVRKLAVEMTFSDNPFGFTLSLSEESGARISIVRPFQKELARTDQSANIRTQLAKLGNTPFEASAVEVQLSEPWFVPSSLLAEMRREGVERLLAAKRIRYRREEQRFTPTHAQFPEKRLTYLGNVANSRAEAFYRVHGVEQVEPAFEQRPRKEVPLMFTKHCLRYSMGWCPRYQKGKSPFKEPYFLQYKETILRLRFDCANCQMLIYQSETK